MHAYRDNLARRSTYMSKPPVPAAARAHSTKPVGDSSSNDDSLKLRDVIRRHILHVLTLTDWVIEGPKGAAALLDMKPSTLRYRIRILDIRKPPKTDAEENVTIMFPRKHIPFRT